MLQSIQVLSLSFCFSSSITQACAQTQLIIITSHHAQAVVMKMKLIHRSKTVTESVTIYPFSSWELWDLWNKHLIFCFNCRSQGSLEHLQMTNKVLNHMCKSFTFTDLHMMTFSVNLGHSHLSGTACVLSGTCALNHHQGKLLVSLISCLKNANYPISQRK